MKENAFFEQGEKTPQFFLNRFVRFVYPIRINGGVIGERSTPHRVGSESIFLRRIWSAGAIKGIRLNNKVGDTSYQKIFLRGGGY